MPDFQTRCAAIDADEARRWVCASCDTFVEVDGAEFCRACSQYWSDVASGLFDFDLIDLDQL